MSLIYNALQPQPHTSATMTGIARAQPHHAVRYLHYGLYALASVVTMLVVFSVFPATDDQTSTVPDSTPVHTPATPALPVAATQAVVYQAVLQPPKATPVNTALPVSKQDRIPPVLTVTVQSPPKSDPVPKVRHATAQPSVPTPIVNAEIKTDATLKARAYLAEVQHLVGQLRQAMARKDATVVEPLLDLLEMRAGKNVAISLKMRAYWLLQQHDNDAAASLYRRLLTLQPNDAQANLNMAVIELRNGEREQAQARVARLAMLYPDSGSVRRFQQQLGGDRG